MHKGLVLFVFIITISSSLFIYFYHEKGFGTTLDSINDIRFDNEPTVLQHLKVMYIPNEDCEEPAPFEYPTGFISETMMCASDPGVGDSCEGDSGGPLFDKETGTLVGIVSWGVNCANEAYPGVNARVSKAVSQITLYTTSCILPKEIFPLK